VAQLRTNTILARLTMMNMLVSAVALLLACAGFLAYDQITFRQNLERTLSAQAQIIGFNSMSAILFDDAQAAYATLSPLEDSQNILAAGIFTLDQRALAQYAQRPSDALASVPAPASGRAEQYWFVAGQLILVRQIMSEGKPIGFVYLKSDLGELDQRLKQYGLIALGVLLISWLITILVSAAFSRSVARPIVELADVARQISHDKNYKIRVAPTAGNDEVTVLIRSFNEMLQESQRSHEELEQRVADRTRELLSANQELEAFSSAVSHDLRGPLESINGYTYLLANHLGTFEPETQELVAGIRGSVKRMAELIDDLLNLSRVSSSAMIEEKVDLSAIARSIMIDLFLTAPERKVDFTAANAQPVYGDARLLRIVMDNLLRNAWKYTSHRDHARIEFGQIERDGRITYFVRDTGSGFDQSAAGRLFQPFQRLHSKEEFPGHGIGLATVRRIIRRHGGDIWAEGAIERGATFYFTLGLRHARSTREAS
jgi:signal transduction histidine kinase